LYSSLHSSGAPLDLHSFPTRRSSDLRSRNAFVCDPFILTGPLARDQQNRKLDKLLGNGRIEAELFANLLNHIRQLRVVQQRNERDRKSTRLNSSHVKISYAVFCLKKK